MTVEHIGRGRQRWCTQVSSKTLHQRRAATNSPPRAPSSELSHLREDVLQQEYTCSDARLGRM